MNTSKTNKLQPCDVAGESIFFFGFCLWKWDWWEKHILNLNWLQTTQHLNKKNGVAKNFPFMRFKQFFPFPFFWTWGPLPGPRVLRTATPELGRPHVHCQDQAVRLHTHKLDGYDRIWMDHENLSRSFFNRYYKKSVLKPWKPTAVGVELLLRARVLEAALFVAGGAYFCITWCFSQLLWSCAEFLYTSDSHIMSIDIDSGGKNDSSK